MPPIMIATSKYKKQPAGTEIAVSASSAKAMSALGLADYKTTDAPPVISREMQAESTNSFADRVYGQLPVNEPSADASATVDVVVDDALEVANVDAESVAIDNADAEDAVSEVTPVVGSIGAKTEDTKIQQNKKSNHKSKK